MNKYNYIENKETGNITPLTLEDKDQYYLDLRNIENGWIGQIELLPLNIFNQEAIQLIINAITLFEKGYLDCAFYSLRQSLEISMTIVFFADCSDGERNQLMQDWKKQEQFPMFSQMVKELEKRNNVFAEIKNKMKDFFEEIRKDIRKINKYVHKQGFNNYYTWRIHPLNKEGWQKLIISDFNYYLKKCFGAIAVNRLAIDPLPVLLADEDIFKRTKEFLTEGFSEDFMNKYIGKKHIESYKTSTAYTEAYEYFLSLEEMLPAVIDVVKHQHIDNTKINEIKSQKHLLSNNDLIAVSLIEYSEKVLKVICNGGFTMYTTTTSSVLDFKAWSLGVEDMIVKGNKRQNAQYGDSYLSHISINNEDYYIEHIETFTEEEVSEIYKAGPLYLS